MFIHVTEVSMRRDFGDQVGAIVMSNPLFELKRPLGRSYRVDLGDTRRAKEALQQLGYYETPSYGMTDYPDEHLFKAIESFQNDNDLPVTGIVRPEDETASRLDDEMAKLPPSSDGGHRWRTALGFQDFPKSELFSIAGDVGEGRHNDSADVQNARRALGWAGFLPMNSESGDESSADEGLFNAIREFQQAKGLESDGWMHPGGETEWHLGQEIEPKVREWQAANQNDRPSAKGDDIEIAQTTIDAPISPIPLGTAALTGTALLEMMRRGMMPEGWNDNAKSDRTDIAPPMPSTPPSEPTAEDDGSKEEFPASPPVIPTLGGRPINEVIKTDPVVYQALSDAILRALQAPLEAGLGDEHTRWGNAESVKIGQRVFSEWGPDAELKHVGGAYQNGAFEDEDKRLKEAYRPGPGGGTKGSSNADMTFIPHLDGKDLDILHTNTGLTKRDGSAIALEDRQLKKLVENAPGELVGYLPKYRPWMDKDEWAGRVEEKFREIFTRLYGKPHS